MQKVVFGTTEFLAKSITQEGYEGLNNIVITFDNSVTFSEVQAFFDPINIDFSPTILRRMEVYMQVVTTQTNDKGEQETVTTWELQGVHIGYTKPIDICVDIKQNHVSVKIEKELQVETDLFALKSEVEITQSVIDELMVGGN